MKRSARPRPRLLPLLFVAALTLAAPAANSQDATRFEPKHVAATRMVTSAAVSPDGNHIAYNVVVPRSPLVDDDGPARVELHLANRLGDDEPADAATEEDAGWTTRRFIGGKVNVGSPQWSSGGDAIYYTAKRTGDEHAAIYRIPVDGGESVRVQQHATSIRSFDLSPTDDRIAFLAKPEQDADEVKLADEGFSQEIYEEDWQPTKVWIADASSVPEDESGASSDLTATDRGPSGGTAPRMLELPGSAHDVRWSPNGRELMVVLAPTPSVDDSYMFKQVHIVDAEAGRIIRTIEHQAKLGQVEWSPDGKRIAMIVGEDLHDPHEGRLFVVSVDGESEPADRTPDFEGQINRIAWIDDSRIRWLAAQGTGSKFGTVTLADDESPLNNEEPRGIDLGESVFESFSSVGEDGPIALVGHAPSHPAELFVAEPGGSPQRVTNVNPWLESMRLAEQKTVRWTARDGLELEGVLVYPLNHVEGRRYPTIMYVHGGPEAHESNGWVTSYTRPGQLAAARGFAVFYPNYRGSTGRGVEFSKRGQADAAGAEFDDLVDGIDHLIEIGITDPDRVGVTGGSYGGYASAWCATYYSERFAASVMFVGISDNVSKVGTTDIPEEMYLVHHRKRLWDDWDYFLQRSPIRYVERNQTPTLILHGKQDPRVHPSQSLELFRHLKTLDQAPVRLVLYEGEGHGNRKAAARLDYNLRMIRWMEHHLQDRPTDAPPRTLDYRAAMGMPSPGDDE